jgi:nitrate reductase delta subunit
MVTATQTTPDTRVLGLFAQLVDYPRPGIAAAARECRRLVEQESPEAAALLDEFAAFAERTPDDMLEEIYTATFDLNAHCHPYIGFHIFGEDYRRSQFLLELKELFRTHGYDPGIELPDHLARILQFMAICPDQELRSELGREALVRTLVPMMIGEQEAPVLEEGEPAPELFDPAADYRRVLQALLLVLEARYGRPNDLEAIPLPDQERLVS